MRVCGVRCGRCELCLWFVVCPCFGGGFFLGRTRNEPAQFRTVAQNPNEPDPSSVPYTCCSGDRWLYGKAKRLGLPVLVPPLTRPLSARFDSHPPHPSARRPSPPASFDPLVACPTHQPIVSTVGVPTVGGVAEKPLRKPPTPRPRRFGRYRSVIGYSLHPCCRCFGARYE